MSALLHWLTSSGEYFHQLGWWGVLLFAAGIVVAQMFIAPLSPVALAAGLIFGFGRGWLALTLGTAVGAAINFLIARYLARGPIARRLEKNEKFRLIDAAIGREGWKIVALLRFVPMPFGLANYAYGLTAIRFWPYLLASVAAIVPANTFLVYLGYTAQAGLAVASGAARPRHPGEYALLAVGLVAFFFALRHITKIARTAVAQSAGASLQ
jgi:uncharacterized membrane protein YdjX (TVP38/TMEM64 family)